MTMVELSQWIWYATLVVCSLLAWRRKNVKSSGPKKQFSLSTSTEITVRSAIKAESIYLVTMFSVAIGSNSVINCHKKTVDAFRGPC